MQSHRTMKDHRHISAPMRREVVENNSMAIGHHKGIIARFEWCDSSAHGTIE